MATADRIETGAPQQRRRPPPRLTPLGANDAVVTKAELIRLFYPNWPTISPDLDHAGRNGLRAAAGALAQGKYWALRAQRWAEVHGRWKAPAARVSSVFARRG